MQFIDRKAKYPGRWTMKKSDGTSEVVTLIRNDEPTVEGTPLNAETLNQLSDVAGADVARAEAEAAAQNAQKIVNDAKSEIDASAENAVQKAGKDIDAKAAAALESIPEEYTELDGSVKQLNNKMGRLIKAHKNINYKHGTMPITYSATSSMWSVPYTNSSQKQFTLKVGIDRIDGYAGVLAIRLQARKQAAAHIAQIDAYIPKDVSQNDIVLHYDFGDVDLSGIKDFNVSVIFVTSGSITIKYFGLFEGKIDDLNSYNKNEEYMYVSESYSKTETEALAEKTLNESKLYTDTKTGTVNNTNKKAENPLFDLFGAYGNREVKIVMVGDSTTDGVNGAAAGLYATLKLYQCGGEILEGATIIDKGSNGAMASGYINGYEDNKGLLYDAVKENGDLYVVSFGLNDIRDSGVTSQIIANRLSTIVDAILADTKGKVILRVPNPFREDYNAVSTMTAQECTNVIYEAYMLIKNKWAKDKVRMLDMQTLVFGKKALPVDSNVLMNDSTHPKGLQNPSWATRDQYGLNKVARVIAESIGKTPTMTDAEYRKIVFDGEENDFQNHPMILTYKTESYTLIKDELSFGGMGTNYLDIWSITSEEMSKILAKGDIVSLGNKSAFVFDGTISVGTSSSNTRLGGQTYPVICSQNEVATVRIYRVIN